MESQKKKFWIRGGIIYAILFLLLVLIINLSTVNAWLGSVVFLLRPLIIGLVLSYLLNPFFRFFERKLFEKIQPFKLRRALALIFSYLMLFLIFFVLIMLIVPQLLESILYFIDNHETYLRETSVHINSLIGFVNKQFTEAGESPLIPYLGPETLHNAVSDFLQSINVDKQSLMGFLTSDNIFTIINIASNIVSLIADILFGFFISIYFLSTKEKRYAQVMRLRRALFSDETNAQITRFCGIADRSFGGFLEGKLIDSAIIGVLVYIALSIFQVPYAILIATIVGITDIVPVIGPFIGVIPSAVIILLTDPPKIIPFLICILVIQQIDGNIIAPKILGENTGVSSLCVIIAITTMGALWGLVGMVLGVPLFATVLELSDTYLEKRLQKKGIATEKKKEEPEGGLIKRFKKRAIRLRENTADGGEGDLTRFEKLQLDTYALAIKHHIFSESSDDALSRFATERAALLNAVETADANLEQTGEAMPYYPEPLPAEECAEEAAQAEESAENASEETVPEDMEAESAEATPEKEAAVAENKN